MQLRLRFLVLQSRSSVRFIAKNMFGPIRTLILAAALYLPLALFVWFAFAAVVVTPVLWMVKLILLNWLPDLFLEISRNQYQIALLVPFVSDPAQLNGLQPGQKAGVDVLVNPMIYGYGLPVIAGLALATPTTLKHRAKQIFWGAILVILIQTNGVVWEAILSISRNLIGGHEAILAHGFNPEFLAGMYQLGYLILSPLLPVIFWALMNRKFIEDLIQLDHIETLEEFAELDAVKAADSDANKS